MMRSARYIVLALGLSSLLAGSVACGQSQVAASELAKLDREIPQLSRSMSLSEVEQRLGPPDDVSELEGGTVAAHYGLWQLVFEPNLVVRERFYRAGYWPRGRPFAPLDRKIDALRLGASRAAVEAKLGKTEAWQILDFKKRERIWYGNGRWRLSFRNQALAGRKWY
jgi:hypothetical protein